MKVILLQELRGKGGEGDVVEVANGYAVNYLFPRRIAIEATKGNLKQLEQRRHNIAKREASRLDTADKLLAALEGKIVRIPAKVGEEGQLFGSVTTTQIAEALFALHNIEVDRKDIATHEPIKMVGEHVVVVSIYREIKANITVLVVDENAPIEEEEAGEDAEATDASDATDASVADAEVDGTDEETAEAEATEIADATEAVEA